MSDTDRIDYLTKIIAHAKQTQMEIRPITEEGERAKGELLDILSDMGAERIRKNGVVVSKAVKTTYKVRSLTDVVAWLESQDMLGKYMTVDAQKLYKDFPDAPGLYISETEYLSVREDTKGE